jgi:ammonium transporter, Amt family
LFAGSIQTQIVRIAGIEMSRTEITSMKKLFSTILAAGLFSLMPLLAFAGSAESPEQPAAAAIDSGDTAWMLTSSALVLFMTAPGLALFYGGLVRQRNVLGMMVQCFAIIGIATLVWIFWGYSLAFGGDPENPGRFIGGFDKLFLRGVEVNSVHGTIPETTFLVFQMMFAIITPALITGAYAERMKFSAMAIFTLLWLTFIYCPLAHMVWGGGWLAGGIADGLDFAGGTVVHVSSGISALVCALVLGPRRNWPGAAHIPHSVVLSFIGACMLWVGWFGFNAGSQLASDGNASMAFLVTQVAAATAALTWAMAERIHRGKPGVLGTITGAVGGLVAITPASGFVGPMAAVCIGLAAGVLCYLSVAVVKSALKYDDSLDAFGVHGVGGIAGAILTGVFATRAITGDADPVGAIDGNWAQVWDQVVTVLVTIVLAAVGSWVILKITSAISGLRITEEEEETGLDLTQHGEEGYNLKG